MRDREETELTMRNVAPGATEAEGGSVHDRCPICASGRLLACWTINGYAIASCEDCSLVFVQNVITAADLARHYASGRDEVYEDDNLECLNYYYKKLRGRIESLHRAPGRILDIGCSGGWFLDLMQGWDCHGVEIVRADSEAARGRYGDRIHEGSFEDYPAREEFFDVITLQDVFDHMRDPMAALAKCHRALKPGGLIVIKVHNISCLYAKLTGPNFYALIPPSHLFYYNRKTLDLALGKMGFRTLETRYIGHLLKVATVFHRLSRGNPRSKWHWLYSRLRKSRVGNLKIRKNLRDIITVIGRKS
jgi:SAM-dependent methyltransferase